MTHFLSALAGVIAVIVIAYCMYRAVMRARTPQGAVGWMIFLGTAPWLAVPAFLFLGRNRFREFAAERHRSLELRRRVAKEAVGLADVEPGPSRLGAFSHLVGLPGTDSNDFHLLLNGEATFEAIFDAVDEAKSYVCVQFYTIVDDELGNALAERLIAAAQRGVAVRLLYDSIGSYTLSTAYLERLRASGVEVAARRLAHWPPWRLQINFRNHRKIVIVDGTTGFLGGHNVSDDYMGRGKQFDHWRDTHIWMRGPVVSQLQLAFLEDWHWASGDSLAEPLSWRTEPQEAGMTGLIAPMGPSDDMDTGTLFFVLAAQQAKARLWIATPYFVPDGDVSSALAAAALRGVDVRVIVPENSDSFLLWLAAFAFFDPIRKAGVKVYRYGKGFMHQKILLIDNDLACVGTANLDNRSFRLNFETMAIVNDSNFAGEVEAMLQADLESSILLERALKDQRAIVRYGAPFARLFAPIL
ncbi:cardiolipin synthase [Seohaeicola nanhaiensis]|uniref:Cardiolipin synthase n=1 Tax=Seohaeicola nanhaiensis TaxID=1387282 RepID=A0ABV9KJU3_9RHOB